MVARFFCFFGWRETKQLFFSNGMHSWCGLGSKDRPLVMGISCLEKYSIIYFHLILFKHETLHFPDENAKRKMVTSSKLSLAFLHSLISTASGVYGEQTFPRSDETKLVHDVKIQSGTAASRYQSPHGTVATFINANWPRSIDHSQMIWVITKDDSLDWLAESGIIHIIWFISLSQSLRYHRDQRFPVSGYFVQASRS